MRLRFRKREKESQKQYEERQKEVRAKLDNDKSFLKTQDLNFKDLVTVIIDDEGTSYQDKDFKKAAKGQLRVYKAFEIWTLDDLVDEGVTPNRAMSILGVDINGR